MLTDRQWNLIADLFPWIPPAKQGGRPKVHPRDCLEGVLWILVTGARWKDLPKAYPSKATCHRRHAARSGDGTLMKVWERLLITMDENGQIDLSETFGDGTFASASSLEHFSIENCGVKRLVPPVVGKAQIL
ncbi:MAG TPA: hypothetical protein DD473_07655 [Planctomycetaceae bacterium]|nr:hypothetical protein [Planctomycetaceae bacterium]